MISDYTRLLCARLCVEKAVEMEIARLDRKGAILRTRKLTALEAQRDVEERAEAKRLVETAQRSASDVQAPRGTRRS